MLTGHAHEGGWHREKGPGVVCDRGVMSVQEQDAAAGTYAPLHTFIPPFPLQK